MIDQIRFKTARRTGGKPFDVAIVWIAGIPFCADLSAHVEGVCRRISADTGADIVDVREKAEERRP